MNTVFLATTTALVQSFFTLQGWCNLPIVIMLLMLQDIHPKIIYELLPHFQLKRREIRNIILAMMQLRLFSSSFLPRLRNLSHRSYFEIRKRQSGIFRSRSFAVLLQNCGFVKTLK